MAEALAEVKEEVKEKEWPTVVLRPLIYYPESDGEPMAETDTHRKQMVYLIEALDDYFRDDPQVYVAGNLLLYYEEGDPRQVVAPDVFVVKGVPPLARRPSSPGRPPPPLCSSSAPAREGSRPFGPGIT